MTGTARGGHNHRAVAARLVTRRRNGDTSAVDDLLRVLPLGDYADLITALAELAAATLNTAGNDKPMLLKLSQAAWELGISRSALYAFIRSGEIRPVSLGPKTRRVPRTELDAFIRRRISASGEPQDR